MSDGFSQYQKSRLGVSAAKARAISERSQGTFDLGITAIEEKEALLRAEDQLQQIAKDAERNAANRGRKAGLGRLIGSGIGYAIGGPLGQAAIGTALGGLAGTAAAGGFKDYGVDVPDSLVPGGILYGRERDAFKQRAEDLEEAFDDLTDAQREGIGKNVLTDYLTGRGLGKLGEANIKGTNASLDDLLEAGEISNVDYLKDIFRSAAGGIGEDRLSVLEPLATKLSTDTNSMLYGAYGKSVGPLNSLTNLDLGGKGSSKIDMNSLFIGNDDIQPGSLLPKLDDKKNTFLQNATKKSDSLDSILEGIRNKTPISEFKNQAKQQGLSFNSTNYESFLDVNENLPRGLSQLNKEQQNTLYDILSNKVAGGKLGVDYTPYEQQLLSILSYDQKYTGSQFPGYYDDVQQFEKDAYNINLNNRNSLFSQQTPLRYLQGI